MISWEWAAVILMGGFTLFAVIILIYDYLGRRSEKKAKNGRA